MTKQKKRIIWILWLLIWPTLIFYLYQLMGHRVNIEGNWFDIISFALLMCIVSLFPIIVGETPIFFIHGISFAVFLHFGLFAEVVLTQIAVIALIMKLRIGKEDLYRIPANLLLFLLTSIIGAAVYFMLGGVNTDAARAFTVEQQLPILGYIIGVIFGNQILLHLLRMFITSQKERFFSRSLLWDVLTSIITIPVGYVLYLLYIELGAKAIYFVGIPFIMISIMIMGYYASKKLNTYMQKTSDIGQKLTGKLDVKEVLDIFAAEITSLLDVHYGYIYDVLNSNESLTLVRNLGDQKGPPSPQTFKKFQGISGMVYGNGEGLFFTKRTIWESSIPDYSIPNDAESLISVPIRRNEKVVGIITIASRNKRAYEKYQYMLVEIMANYLAVAIENARHYESTKQKSERCQLTKLYNYRYFEEYLHHLFEDMIAKGVKEIHSLILLDLDYFKRVNDTYGHESGNEVLRELAKRIETAMNNSIVARYGGEEFVVLLQGRGKDEALFEAEKLRRIISEQPFQLEQHITDVDNPIQVNLTASIGIATFPDDCDDPTELIRHADRAMYVGAKNNGRNKVATYEKVIQM
ncbi:sensor domain-containing diguanylate cyclase [Salinibacillus xinjiangensis]|nr:sensor domain-containing diguanylate cyclase [Salinibacillus xinjiangensis]